MVKSLSSGPFYESTAIKRLQRLLRQDYATGDLNQPEIPLCPLWLKGGRGEEIAGEEILRFAQNDTVTAQAF